MVGTRFKARECRDGLWHCYKCETWKPANDFHKDNNSKSSSGLRYDCKECACKQVRIWYHGLEDSEKKELIDRQNAGGRKRKFGVSQEQYNEMLERQGYVCAICEEPCKSGRKLSVDHNHTTGQIRDLLCSRCNTAIGQARESTDILYAMIKYLEKWT